jgi:MFS family permease
MQIDERYPWLKEIRPLWLPSGILLLTSFLLLALATEKKRRRAGWIFIALSVIGLLLGSFAGSATCLSEISPLWLPLSLLFVSGLVFLCVDCAKTTRIVALTALIAAGVLLIGSLIGYLAGDKWPWLEQSQIVSRCGWNGLLIGLAGAIVLLSGITKRWHSYYAFALTIAAVTLLVFSAIDASMLGARYSMAMGPLWVYGLLALAAAFVLFTPDRRELTRYFGYSTLVLSLTSGLLVNFFAGKLGDLRIGPFPAGTPVNLITNVNPDADPKELARALKITLNGLAEIRSTSLTGKDAQKVMREKIAPALMSINKCPDFVMDKGHDFAWFKDMTDEDKNALIELLKTF